jgi:hypothetical protein
MDELAKIVELRIKRKRIEMNQYAKEEDYCKCVNIQGQIEALENVFLDIRNLFQEERRK